MKYLIVLTNYNLSTIIAKKYVCSIFVNKILKEKKIENSNREDIEKFINYISSKYSRWNDYVCELKQFYEWLSINNFICPHGIINTLFCTISNFSPTWGEISIFLKCS